MDRSSWYRVTVAESDRGRLWMEVGYGWGRNLHELGIDAPDAAVFMTKLPRETVDFFFSPEALIVLADLVERRGGVPCDPPSPEGLTRVIGTEDAAERKLGGVATSK